jgi:hypothetical protein
MRIPPDNLILRQLPKRSYSFQLGNLLFLVLLAALACGCATPALWKSTAGREWKPMAPDHVMLLTNINQQREVVVLFHQIAAVGKTNSLRIVGWRLGQSSGELAITPRAIDQLTNSCGQFAPVPLFLAGAVPANASSQAPGYAIWNSMDQQLTVYLDGYPCGPYLLPTTRTDRRTALRVLGLPFAVAADAAIVLISLSVAGLGGPMGPG